jgi:uncharacterized integral membrane protein (TIGR00698 family)
MASDIQTDEAIAHGLFHSYDAMEGLPHQPAAVAPAHPARRFIREIWPGFLVAATIALASTWLSQHYTAPVMLFALLFGMAFHFLHEEGRCVAGIEFASKAVLRLGVALLGARITAAQILGLGLTPILTVIAGVSTTIAVGALTARLLGRRLSFGVLSGGAVGVCGASAALAIASVLPRNDDSERDTILVVVLVTTLSTLAMIFYPIFAVSLGLDHVRAGVFLGGTIHDVAQVVGAGYSISQQTGDIATYVKLLRVSMLLPVVFAIAFAAARAHAGDGTGPKARLPLFLVAFAALVVVNSLGWITKPMGDVASEVSRWCLVAAIAALGMKTSFRSLVAVGWRPVAVMAIETAWLFVLVLTAVLLFR